VQDVSGGRADLLPGRAPSIDLATSIIWSSCLQLSKPEQRPKPIDLHRDLDRTTGSRSYRAGREADRDRPLMGVSRPQVRPPQDDARRPTGTHRCRGVGCAQKAAGTAPPSECASYDHRGAQPSQPSAPSPPAVATPSEEERDGASRGPRLFVLLTAAAAQALKPLRGAS
jgi:hypothetical protein